MAKRIIQKHILQYMLWSYIFLVKCMGSKISHKLLTNNISLKFIIYMVNKSLNKKKTFRDKNIQLIFPNLSDDERKLFKKKYYQSFIETVLEEILLSPKKRPNYEVIGSKHLEGLGKSKILFVSAHIGAISMVEVCNLDMGYQGFSLYKETSNVAFGKISHKMRSRFSSPISIENTDTFVKKIESHHNVIIYTDLRIKSKRNGKRLRFCNHPAWSSTFIAEMAIKYDCSIVPVFAVRQSFFNYQVIYEAPIDTSSKDKVAITQLINDVISARVMENPTSWWLWNTNRWGR